MKISLSDDYSELPVVLTSKGKGSLPCFVKKKIDDYICLIGHVETMCFV